MWWYFDRTTIGFGMGIIVAALATLATQVLVYHRICNYSEREFSYVQSWLPCVVFSGGITVANIGKQLAVVSGIHFFIIKYVGALSRLTHPDSKRVRQSGDSNCCTAIYKYLSRGIFQLDNGFHIPSCIPLCSVGCQRVTLTFRSPDFSPIELEWNIAGRQ
ncbi:insulin-induced gene 2 protein [Trichonephila clavipes]|nr:insulin-induced gene 2 protein [Trichonephila clavipes]